MMDRMDAQSMDELHAWAGLAGSSITPDLADTPNIYQSGQQVYDHLASIQRAQRAQDTQAPSLPKRFWIPVVLIGVIIAWWILGRVLPGDRVTRAHRAVAPNVAGSATTAAAVGIT
jgi:hypothetical protein